MLSYDNSPSVNVRRQSNQSTLNMIILFSINLLNYMDRSIIPGVIDDIIAYFNISNILAGLLSTVFISSYMILAPVFGYLGDRYNRSRLMAFGVALWSVFTFLGSFVKPTHLVLFYLSRALVGIGEASYSCIAPSVIGDLYDGPIRSKMLAIYYLAIPVGSGLGYIVGSKVALWMNNWQWALCVTPIFGVLAVLLLVFVVRDPPRGMADNVQNLQTSSYIQDIAFLLRNKTYVSATIAFTAVAFVLGVMTWWMIQFMKFSYATLNKDITNVSLLFGVITCLGGLFGVIIGSLSSSRLKKRTQKADPLVCGFSILVAIPFLFIAIMFANRVLWLSWLCIFLATTAVCCTWPLIADIILFVVIPAKRGTAEAIQILISHLFGDATSPYIIGMIADVIFAKRQKLPNPSSMNETTLEALNKFIAFQYALYTNIFIALIGGIGFLVTSFYIVEDRRIAESLMHGLDLSTSVL